MSRRKPLKSLSDWIGAGGHSFNGSLLKSDDDGAIRQLELDRIIAGRYQPRHRTDDDYLAELERSVRQFGIIEPLVVRPLADGSYEILAGHMRWRAAQQAGLQRVPVVIREADDRTAAAIALVENLLRRELNPICLLYTSHPRVVVLGLENPEQFQSAHAAHVQIEQDQVRPQLASQRQSLPAFAGLADHPQRTLHCDQLQDALAHQRVIVDDQDGLDVVRHTASPARLRPRLFGRRRGRSAAPLASRRWRAIAGSGCRPGGGPVRA